MKKSGRTSRAPRRVARRPASQRAMPRWRFVAIASLLALFPAGVLWQAARLQVLPDVERGFKFLQSEGVTRSVHREEIPAYRGVITDRRGEPLAISTPMVSLTADPQLLDLAEGRLDILAKALGERSRDLAQRIEGYIEREARFMYLKRRLTPGDAQRVLTLGIPGVGKEVEYKRYYPAAEVTAQLIGITNVRDVGQEGLELAFESRLAGRAGEKKVLRDRKGRVIEELQLVRSEQPGENLELSIDLRLQYLAYRELKAAIKKFRARSGSVVLLDVESAEVLAMANQPSFNPNDRARLASQALRNRAVINIIEPGSTMKPFTMVAALESGQFTPHTVVDTSPGHFRVGRKTFVDFRNYGPLDLTHILAKSSQVGTTKVALELEPQAIRNVFARVGLGESTATGFPGELAGTLPNPRRWGQLAHATLAFGYGLSVTPLQLANAYAVLARDGQRRSVSLLKQAPESHLASAGEQVIEPRIARQVRAMMKAVTEEGGTGTRAAVAGYDVAGKSGTVHQLGDSGYDKNRYVAIFAGMVPVENPRLVAVVVIEDPRSEEYYGGLVAAPVFSRVASDALRLLNIAPQETAAQHVSRKKGGEPAPRATDAGTPNSTSTVQVGRGPA